MNQMLAVFPSGRVLDRSLLYEYAIAIQAQALPSIIYMSIEKE